MKKLFLLLLLVNFFIQIAVAQKKHEIMIRQFDDKPQTESWWRDNEHVKFSYNDIKKDQVNKGSKACLYVRWDSIPTDKPFIWFTDLKADSLAADGMESKWKSFRQNTWLSFWCKGGDGDTLMLQYLVLSKGHKSK